MKSIAAAVLLATPFLSAQAGNLCNPTSVSSATPAISDSACQSLLQTLQQRRIAARLDSEHDYQLSSTLLIHGKTIRQVWQHRYRQLPISGSQLVADLDLQGRVQNIVESDLRAGLFKGIQGDALNTTPNISEQDAIRIAQEKLAPGKLSMIKAALFIQPQQTRVTAPGGAKSAETAYRLNGHRLIWQIRAVCQEQGQVSERSIEIAADDGSLLSNLNTQQHLSAEGLSKFSGRISFDNTQDSQGRFVAYDTSRGMQANPLFGFKHPGLFAIDMRHFPQPENKDGFLNVFTNLSLEKLQSAMYVSDSNTWGDYTLPGFDLSSQAPNQKTIVADAMYGMQQTYDMMAKTFMHKGLDTNDRGIFAALHVNFGNSLFSSTCFCIVIGDGDADKMPMATPDIMAHEYAHAILTYMRLLPVTDMSNAETRGLNESAADILALALKGYLRNPYKDGNLDNFVLQPQDWAVGMGVSRNEPHIPLRWMDKPSRIASQLDVWDERLAKILNDSPSETAKVHLAAGPHNRMFYLLMNGSSTDPNAANFVAPRDDGKHVIKGLGLKRAFQLWYATLTSSRLGLPNMRYINLLETMQDTAATAEEKIAVRNAFAAVGINAPKPPACQTLSSNSSSVPAEGGLLSAQAACDPAPMTYGWTLQKPGSAAIQQATPNAAFQYTLPPNTSASPQSWSLCVKSFLANGSSSEPLCKTITQAASTLKQISCDNLAITPATLPYSGGRASANANCSAADKLSYVWSVNNINFPGNTAQFSQDLRPVYSSTPSTWQVCVNVSAAGYQERKLCASFTQLGMQAVTCSGIQLQPAQLAGRGDNLLATAQCSGDALNYSWSFDNAPYGGNSQQVPGYFPRNPSSEQARSWPLCVSVSNAVSQGPRICQTVTQLPAPPAAPSCNLILSPASLPAAGGSASANANCSNKVNEYRWTLNGAPFGANSATISSPVGRNSTGQPLRYDVCAWAYNEGGFDKSCKTLTVEAEIKPQAPQCSLSLSPAVLPRSGGTASATAVCSGSGLSYRWTFNGAPYGDNKSSISGPFNPNTGARQSWPVCVTVGNQTGSTNACATLSQE